MAKVCHRHGSVFRVLSGTIHEPAFRPIELDLKETYGQLDAIDHDDGETVRQDMEIEKGRRQ